MSHSDRFARARAVVTHTVQRWAGDVMRVLVLTLGVLFTLSATAQVRYYYDELGRLIEAVAPDGASVQYAYDPAGNITLIRRSGVNALSLTEITPNSGPVGSSVQLYGSGFSTTAASNTVLFGGVAATVTSASASSLAVTVPTGATTGRIHVSNGNGSVQSTTDFIVAATAPAPTISSFSPNIGNAGTVVTVAGTNFRNAPVENRVSVGDGFANVLADVGNPTPTQLKFRSSEGVYSGKISITTPYGKATSAGEFYALPPGVNAADVQFKGRAVVGGAALAVTTTTAGKKAVILFEGAAGQWLHWSTSGGTFAGALTVQVYQPDGRLHEQFSLKNSGLTDFKSHLSTSGTYTVIVSPAATDLGRINVGLLSDVVGTLTVDGATAVSLSSGQNGRYSFTAEAGKGYGLALTGLAFTPVENGSMYVLLKRSDGTTLTSCSFSINTSCDFSSTYFSATGTYLLDFDPQGAHAAVFNVILSKDASGTLTVDAATPTTVAIAREGQNASFKFNGTAGQLLSVLFKDKALDDGNAGTEAYTDVEVRGPGGTSLGNATLYGALVDRVFDLTLAESGTYTVDVKPRNLDRGTASLQVKSYLTGVLPLDAAKAVSLSEGRNARFSFTAEAGKGYGLVVTELTSTPATNQGMTARLRRGDGTALTTCSLGGGNSCSFDPTYFAAAGTYLLDFDPAGVSATAFNAILSKDAGGSLTLDSATPTTVTIERAGQNARYTFNGTAGQLVSLVITGSTMDDGDGDAANYNYTYVYLNKPDGTRLELLSLSTTSASGTLDARLPENGTYTVYIDPQNFYRGAMSLQLKSYLTGALTADTAQEVNLSPGRNARYSFTAEAGKGYGLAMAGLAFTPAAGGSMWVKLMQADGTVITTNQCWAPRSGSCNFDPKDFPSAGTYLLDFAPVGVNATVFNATVGKDLSGTLTVDALAPTTVTIPREGLNARYTFSGTAGQKVSVLVTGSTMDDGDSSTSNYTYVYLYQVDGKNLGEVSLYSGTAAGRFDATLPANGIYTVYVNPQGVDRGSVGVRVVKVP